MIGYPISTRMSGFMEKKALLLDTLGDMVLVRIYIGAMTTMAITLFVALLFGYQFINQNLQNSVRNNA